jgi:hypothetical protein
MDLHQNARLTFRSREALANKITIEKLTLSGFTAIAACDCPACVIVPRGLSTARAEPRRSGSLRSSACDASYALPIRSPKPPV